jgi:hypothetical protein
VLAGCAATAHLPRAEQSYRVPATHEETLLGLRVAAVPAGYRPVLSARAVLDRFRRAQFRESNARGKPAVHLWTVNRAYPAWVLTFRSPGNTSVAVYDLRGRRWTMSFRLPLPNSHGPPPCRGGLCGFPLNQGGLDVAAGYAERVAGAAHVFAGDRVDDVADKVVVHLVHAPRSVIDALNAAHPGTYVIRNNASRTLAAVMEVERALDFTALQSQGIAIVSAWPNGEGRLMVGVTRDIPKAQSYFDAAYGRGFVRVVHGEPIGPTRATGVVP